MSATDQARQAFAEFEHEWFVKKGGPRADGVTAAFRADDLIEAASDDLSEAELDWMIKRLSSVPDVEKRWFGIKDYREYHRVVRHYSAPGQGGTSTQSEGYPEGNDGETGAESE